MLVIYGKHKDMKRYRPLDVSNNKFVFNLMHATCFRESSRALVELKVKHLNLDNEDFHFQIRKK